MHVLNGDVPNIRTRPNGGAQHKLEDAVLECNEGMVVVYHRRCVRVPVLGRT